MGNKHTPAPWLLNDTDNEIFGGNDNYNHISAGNGVYNHYGNIQSGFTLSGYISKENALLITKAPEMLEMLIDMKEYMPYEMKEIVQQLITEATTT